MVSLSHSLQFSTSENIAGQLPATPASPHQLCRQETEISTCSSLSADPPHLPGEVQ